MIINSKFSKVMKRLLKLFQETVSLIKEYFWSRNVVAFSKEVGIRFSDLFIVKDFIEKLDYVDKALELFTEIMKFRSILKPCVTKLYKSCSFTLLPSLKSEFVCKLIRICALTRETSHA